MALASAACLNRQWDKVQLRFLSEAEILRSLRRAGQAFWRDPSAPVLPATCLYLVALRRYRALSSKLDALADNVILANES